MPTIHDRTTGAVIARLSPEQLQTLVDAFAGGASEDGDYTISPATLQLLEDQGADEAMVALLRNALGTREGLEFRWTV